MVVQAGEARAEQRVWRAKVFDVPVRRLLDTGAMTGYQFRKWALTEGLADSWWLLIDGVTEPEPLSMDEIEERLNLGDYAEIQVLHASQAEVEPAPWANLHTFKDEVAKAVNRTAPIIETEKSSPFGVPFLLAPLVGLILVWAIGFHIQGLVAAHNLAIIALASVVVVTAILAALDANQLRMGEGSGTGPVGWFILLCLLWVLFYPIFLICRSRNGGKNYFVGGTLSMAAFLGMVAWLLAAIEQRKVEIVTGLTAGTPIVIEDVLPPMAMPDIASPREHPNLKGPVRSTFEDANLKGPVRDTYEDALQSKRNTRRELWGPFEKLADMVEQKAVSEWPDDFQMQRFEINEQFDALTDLTVMGQVGRKDRHAASNP